MAPSTKPRNWDRIVAHIKARAVDRCECGTIWDCGSAEHPGRCNHVEGRRYRHNGRQVKLRVVQIGKPDDWSPNYLLALCLPCLRVYEHRQAAMSQREAKAVEEEGLFALGEAVTRGGNREEN